MKGICPECSAKFIGRSDKKYCSDQCRNNRNNTRGRRINNMVRRINRRLSCNRRILEELSSQGSEVVHKDILEIRGFDFNLFTSLGKTMDGLDLIYCYEQAYGVISDSSIFILNTKQNFVKSPVLVRKLVYN